jgi:hypothetical protein
MMETFGCLEVEMALKDVWKSVLEEHGALSVTTSGTILMLKLCVTSWALHRQVRRHQTLHKQRYHGINSLINV